MWISENKYKEIIRLIPISCVDLLVVSQENEVLLVKRKNEPEKGQWWLPGGRVHFGETRKDAAIRKLKEECGITVTKAKELKTVDLFLPCCNNEISHSVTTVYKIEIRAKNVILDNQSDDYSWKSVLDWLKIIENDFLISAFKFVIKSL